MEIVPEIVELDCRSYWRRSRLPEEIEEDMQRCNQIWVPVAQVPKTPRMSLEWTWVWRDWEWREGPSISKRARFEMQVEVGLPDKLLDSLRSVAEEQMEERMRGLCKGVSLGVFLCVHEKYVQGLLVEEEGCSATLKKSFVLLGRKHEEG